MVSHQKNRQRILNKLMITLQNANCKLEKEKLIALMSFEEGVSRRTALDYLKTLQTLGKIIETWDKKGTFIEANKAINTLDL